MSGALDWSTDGADWPNRAWSRFTEAGGYRWHVQRAGRGEGLLLVHGTGASTHSWAGLLPELAQRFDVLSVDLPGHAFTRPLRRLDASLLGMTRALKALLEVERFSPSVLVGHSAGAAITVAIAGELTPAPRQVIALNGALQPFSGAAAWAAPLAARALSVNPLVVHALAQGGRNPARVSRLIKGTGSRPGPDYLRIYGRLFGNTGHVSGTLSMMAHWDISGVADSFLKSGMPLHQIVGASDRAVPPSQAKILARRSDRVTVEVLAGLGHLSHEEDAGRICAAILSVAGSDVRLKRKAGA
ncbi:alpha/beta fold hydrolase BchO [Hyphomonas sp.]|uniref:alpha/beta fold hydrolase BchO n=1 Tax=Hyphomonas sp. TaxID=87 RepID=UPI00391DD78A